MKPKIYLSKSNLGTMDSLMKVRELLSKYDAEIIEFQGGEYSDKQLRSSDIVLILPPILPKAFNYDFRLGKGQYSEYEMARFGGKNIYFIICLGDELYVQGFVDAEEILEEDWKLNYAHIWCKETMKPLHEYCKILNFKEIGKPELEIQNKIKPMLCLSSKYNKN